MWKKQLPAETLSRSKFQRRSRPLTPGDRNRTIQRFENTELS
jgi:hypothetical protein